MNLDKKSIKDLDFNVLQGKRVLVRTDFNVPLSPDGIITSDYRIQASLPTLRYLLENQARVILVSHLGRPKGQVDPKYSLKPVAEALREFLPAVTINFLEVPIGEATIEAVDLLQPGQILILENIRFEPGESKNDPVLAKQLANLTDIYVNDAFGAAHRAHASTEGITHYLPVKVAGLLMQQELSALNLLLHSPEKPFTAIIGGSKVSTKIGVLSNLLKTVTNLVIGGGMIFTFLKAKGLEVGSSLVEDDFVETAAQLLKEAEANDKVVVLPKDIVVADRFAADAQHQVVAMNHIPQGWMGLDIGPESIERVQEVLQNSRTVFWNGPLGVFEFPAFAPGTRTIAEEIAKLTQEDFLTSILGGGDTQAAIEQFGIDESQYTHVSTGGGATLELLEGKELPGVVALEDKIPASSHK